MYLKTFSINFANDAQKTFNMCANKTTKSLKILNALPCFKPSAGKDG